MRGMDRVEAQDIMNALRQVAEHIQAGHYRDFPFDSLGVDGAAIASYIDAVGPSDPDRDWEAWIAGFATGVIASRLALARTARPGPAEQ